MFDNEDFSQFKNLQEVRIVSKQYKRYKKAWINTSKGKLGYTEKSVHLIIAIGHSSIVMTHLRKSNVFLVPQIHNFNDAVLDQHPTVEREMNKLAKLLALCQVTESKDMTDRIAAMVDVHRANLEADNMTRWYITEYDEAYVG